MNFLKKYNYVSKEGLKNLDKYVYHGGDDSFIYKYVMSPVA